MVKALEHMFDFCSILYYLFLLEMAEKFLKHATDLSGLLLLYSPLGDTEGI